MLTSASSKLTLKATHYLKDLPDNAPVVFQRNYRAWTGNAPLKVLMLTQKASSLLERKVSLYS